MVWGLKPIQPTRYGPPIGSGSASSGRIVPQPSTSRYSTVTVEPSPTSSVALRTVNTSSRSLSGTMLSPIATMLPWGLTCQTSITSPNAVVCVHATFACVRG